MRMSVCVMADVDEIGFYPHIESLGYDSAWVADSQMLYSDCYAVLALAARQTSRLRGLNSSITQPLSAVILKTASLSLPAFWAVVTSPRVLASYRLSFGASLLAAAVNTVFGFLLTCMVLRSRPKPHVDAGAVAQHVSVRQ